MERRLESVRSKRDQIPDIEAELRRYESDLALGKQQLDDLKARQKRFELGTQVGESEDINFRVIEPPYVPTQPVGPNRPFLFSGALAVALSVGLALAFVIAQLRPTFDTRRGAYQLGRLFLSVNRAFRHVRGSDGHQSEND